MNPASTGKIMRAFRVLFAMVVLWYAAAVLPISPARAADGPYTSWDVRGDVGADLIGPAHYDQGIAVTGTRAKIDLVVDNKQLEIYPAPADQLEAGRTYQVGTFYDEPTVTSLVYKDGGTRCSYYPGSFTIIEMATDPAGNVTSIVLTFKFSCDANDRYTYGSIAYHAATPAPPLPPVVPPSSAFAMTRSPATVDYGRKVTIHVTLDPSAEFRDVSVLARVGSGAEQELAHRTIGADGVLDVSFHPTESATVLAVLHLTGHLEDDVISRTVGVRGHFVSRAFRATGHAHGQATYRHRDAIVGSRLAPDHSGHCVHFRLQALVSGRWGYDSVTPCVRLNRRSTAYVRIPHVAELLGLGLRVRPEWAGDKISAGVAGRWVYVRFLR